MTIVENQSANKATKIPGGVLALLAAAAFKYKSVLWLLGSLSTMVLSIGVFAMGYGLPYAISLVLLIYIHESGHWLWMNAMGLKPKAPMFIPGLGAFVAMTKMPGSEAVHAWVALAGPLIGGLGCAFLYAIGVHSNNGWLMASGNTGFMLNLLQLIPAKPLDGGFVVQAVSRVILIPGSIGLFLLGIVLGSPLLVVIAVFSFFSSGQKLNSRPSTVGSAQSADLPGVNPPPLPAKPWEKFAVAFAYIALVGALGFGYFISLSEVNLTTP